MFSKSIFTSSIGCLARKFRAVQEIWILPWWGSGGFANVPLWALDTLVLVVKLFSTCAMAVVRVVIPPVKKSLYGETVLITGAGNGIGRELAIQLADLGAIVVCWDKDSRRNNAVMDEIRSKNGECIGYTVDVTARDQVSAIAAAMRRRVTDVSMVISNAIISSCIGYTVDVTARDQVSAIAAAMRRRVTDVSMVISNAGALKCAPVLTLKPEAIVKLVEINLLAHFWLIQAFLPSMIERRHGHIVAINSSAGLMPYADMVPYSAAKFGLRGLMESISEELRLDSWTKNINTTSVYLSTVSTGMCPTTHRFTSWHKEVTAQEAAKIIIDGIRKNHKTICIPWFMKFFMDFLNILPYRIRIIFTDFINFSHRGWFCFC